MKIFKYLFLALVFLSACVTKESNSKKEENSVVLDPQIEEIISKLSLEEKVGQMTNLTLSTISSTNEKREIVLDSVKMEQVFLKYHIGSIQNVDGGAYKFEQWQQLIQQLQDYTLTKTKHKIPFLYCIDAVHGANYLLGGTQFPHNLALGATRNTSLTKACSQITAAETRASGIRYNFSPVLDCGRNQQWSRLGETFGEDTYLVTQLGKASIQGFEGETQVNSPTVASCMKHFVGYSVPENGKDRAPAYIPEIVLREHFLPQFQEAVHAGAKTVMVNSAEVNGVPLHANKYLLTDVLRGELGFKGMIISDWQDILKMHERHQVASTHKEAVFLGVKAGIDMCIVPYTFDFTEDLISLVNEGRISMERIDASVRRILTLKKQVGLFENPNIETEFNSYFAKSEYQQTALQAARESLVLLKNKDNILPLSPETKVLLTGPSSADVTALHGAWSYSWQGYDTSLYPDSIKSIKDAFKNATHIESVTFDDNGYSEKQVLRAAKNSDVIVLCLGEESYAETPGNIPDLMFPKDQVKLINQLAKTGKPIIVILLEGRPRIIREIEPLMDGLIVGFWPGSQGAQAIHDVVYGTYNPSGKLPITYPRYSGTLSTYDHRRLDEAVEIDDPYKYYYEFTPQFEFGDGLSYTSFEYGDIQINNDTISDTLNVSIEVRNTGNRHGQEVVELYTRDHFASVTPAVKRLRRFKKVNVAPNESKKVQFELLKKDVSFVNADLKTVFEEGNFELIIGNKRKSFFWLN